MEKDILYTAHIAIAFFAPPDSGAAEDKISAIFTEKLKFENVIADWRYTDHTQWPRPHKEEDGFDELPGDFPQIDF